MLYFAAAREHAGIDREILELDGPLTLGELLSSLCEKRPRLGEIRSALRLAVNLEFVAEPTPLYDGDEVALIPPVSGG